MDSPRNSIDSLSWTLLPSLSSAHRFFTRSADLTDLFLMISTSATSSLTRTDLEKAINAWKLDNSSQGALFTPIMDLTLCLTATGRIIINKMPASQRSSSRSFPESHNNRICRTSFVSHYNKRGCESDKQIECRSYIPASLQLITSMSE